MATGRGLTTEYDRECLRGEHGDQRRYEARSRVRARIHDELVEEIDEFAEHSPNLLTELREVVCPHGND